MARLAIRMPKMSMTMTEGEVASWSVSVGDEVAIGDVVCEVMTDKVDMEVESTVAGTLVEITVESGMAEVGTPIGWVEGEDDGGSFGDLLSEPEPDATPEPAPDAAAAPQPEPDPQSDPRSESQSDLAGSGIVPAVPRARALAREHGIDLASVEATGPDGLVRVPDVEGVLPTPAAPEAPSPVAAPAPAATAPATAKPTVGMDRKAAIRAVVARTMTPSAAIPQFTVWREVTLDAADATRQGLSWTTVLLRAYAAALREVPDLLARWEDDHAVDSGDPAIALAVATERGLLVPVFTEPDRADARALDAELRDVVRAAHSGKLDRRYLGVANGSLSNLGGSGVDRFQALLTPPQASVLSLGSVTRRPVAVPDGLGVRLTVHAGLTVDHRVADGAHAADLLGRFAERLESPL